MRKITTYAKLFFRRLGLNISKFNPTSSLDSQIVAIINHFHCNIVYDVGANYGDFATSIRNAGYSERIVSFEPLPSPRRCLKKLSSIDSKWFLHPQSCIGNRIGMVAINIASNDCASSSILPMLDTHAEAAPSATYIGSIETPICTLDSIRSEYISEDDRIFLKIDVQGAEWDVLDGASDTILNCSVIMIELSLIYLYAGQKLWLETISRLNSMGFTLWTINPAFIDNRNGRTLQVDAIFVRAGEASC